MKTRTCTLPPHFPLTLLHALPDHVRCDSPKGMVGRGVRRRSRLAAAGQPRRVREVPDHDYRHRARSWWKRKKACQAQIASFLATWRNLGSTWPKFFFNFFFSILVLGRVQGGGKKKKDPDDEAPTERILPWRPLRLQIRGPFRPGSHELFDGVAALHHGFVVEVIEHALTVVRFHFRQRPSYGLGAVPRPDISLHLGAIRLDFKACGREVRNARVADDV